MELKLQTSVVKTLTSKVVKGMGNNKMLPITEMIGINIEDNVLSFISTDGKNTVQSHYKLEEPAEDISFAINGNSFAKLVQKTTTESVTLSIEEDKLTFKGNGTYKFSLTLDEEGEVVKIDPIKINKEEFEGDAVQEITTRNLKDAYNINKSSIAITNEYPAYTGFYFDESGVITTNSLKICFFKQPLFKNKLLLKPSFVSLFSLLDGEKVKVYQTSSEIFIVSDDVTLKSEKMIEIEDFPVDNIKPFLENEMPYNVKLNKQALLNLLERISVFVSPFDKNSIKLDFLKEGLRVWTLDGVNNEIIPYVNADKFSEASLLVDVINFKELVSSNPDVELTLTYGSPNAMKLTFGNVTQVIALQDK